MKIARITGAVIALGLMAAGPALAQQAGEPQATPEEHQQHHPKQSQSGGSAPEAKMGMGMMGGQMPPEMMQQMMRNMMSGGGMMGPAMMAGGMPCGQPMADLTADLVQKHLEAHVAMAGNDRLKVGEVSQGADGKITATILTKKEGAVVDKFSIDPKTHVHQRIE
jgi:hypothetical protein